MAERNRLMIRTLAALLALLACGMPVLTAPDEGHPTTIILVRHAEKAGDGTSDPPLTEAGRKRAGELAYSLNHLDLSAVYSTPYRRTRQTAAPAASSHGLAVLPYAADDPDFAKKAAAKHRGGVVLIVGHSNTVPKLVNRLTGRETFAPLDEDIYDNLFIVTIPDGGIPGVVRLRFGESTPKGIAPYQPKSFAVPERDALPPRTRSEPEP